jgi:hypothetical protein
MCRLNHNRRNRGAEVSARGLNPDHDHLTAKILFQIPDHERQRQRVRREKDAAYLRRINDTNRARRSPKLRGVDEYHV